MKLAVLVIGRPSNSQQENITKNLGNFLKGFGMDIFLVTNHPANKDTQKVFKGAYYYDYNPESVRRGLVWHTLPKYKHVKVTSNWCLSVMHLYLRGFKMLKNLGYTHVIAFNYDVELNQNKFEKFINKCILNFHQDKKATFVYFPRHLSKVNNIPIYEDIIDNEHFASETQFFIDLFDQGTQDYRIAHNKDFPLYQENPAFTCEHFWEYMLRPHMSNIDILPREEALQGIMDSESTEQLSNQSYVFYGYNRFTNQVMVYINPYSPVEFISETRSIPFVEDEGYCTLDIKMNEECHVVYTYEGKEYKEYLFTYDEQLNENNFFRELEFDMF